MNVYLPGKSAGASTPANVKAGTPTISSGASGLGVTFGGTAFGAIPSVICNLVPPTGADLISVAPIQVTSAGFSGNWGFAIPSGYILSWIATPTTQ